MAKNEIAVLKQLVRFMIKNMSLHT